MTAHATRQFLRQFRASVKSVACELARAFPVEEEEALHAEALLLLSRLLFLTFIEERGWLDGDRRFLRNRLEKDIAAGRGYFSHTLLPLFFGCLNVPPDERGSARRLGSIPYLNGGLFQPSAFERTHRDLQLPNDLLRRIVLETFGAFQFRMDEDAEDEDAIGPEMLGRVFEWLMGATTRAESGSFYTPRRIANELAGHAIAAWLARNAQADALAQITVLDPACGSGALLLAALNAIARRQKLLGRTPDVRGIVANSLFGVDLSPEAVCLCRLRLWLAIAATHRAGEPIEPLPHLDRNILQGDSLHGGPDFSPKTTAAVYGAMQDLQKQRGLLERYRGAAYSERAALARGLHKIDVRIATALLDRSIAETDQALRECVGVAELRDLNTRRAYTLSARLKEEQALRGRTEDGMLDFFSYHVQFAPVMAAGGFDVVLGNPPWGRSAQLDARARSMLRERYRLLRGADRVERPAFAQPDLAIAFIERAMALTTNQGIVAMVLSSKIATAAFAAPLRHALHGRLLSVLDWSDAMHFDADVCPMGVVLRPHAMSPSIRLVRSGGTADVPALELRAVPGSEWAIVPHALLPLLRRLYADHPPLQAALGQRPFMGVKTGDNARFFLDAQEIVGRRLVTSEGVKVPLASTRLCIRGRDLQRWKLVGSVWMLWPTAEDERTSPPWLQALARARGVTPAVFRINFKATDHGANTVAWKDVSRGVAAAVLPETIKVGMTRIPLIPNQTLYAISARSGDEAHLIAAVLNSTVAGALLVATADRAKDAHYRYFGRTVALLPWPDLAAVERRLVELSWRAHDGADVEPELDPLIARAYGVSDVELSTLRTFLEERLE